MEKQNEPRGKDDGQTNEQDVKSAQRQSVNPQIANDADNETKDKGNLESTADDGDDGKLD